MLLLPRAHGGSIPGQGTNIPQAAQHGQKTKKAVPKPRTSNSQSKFVLLYKSTILYFTLKYLKLTRSVELCYYSGMAILEKSVPSLETHLMNEYYCIYLNT